MVTTARQQVSVYHQGGFLSGNVTVGLHALGVGTLADDAVALQVDVPRLLLAVGVAEREGEDGAAFLDGVFAAGCVALQRVADHVEGLRAWVRGQ